ncbi:MAG: helix-turn-helix transcriptional regulator [Emcibacter sp.]|nr:helix-turn-helix transcriptional regulator [Emcibacter sp.]
MIKKQIPLGELLLKARLNKKLSRAYVCKEANISENSLVRYEKAGIDKNGKYPPAPKLASLCFLLEISPMDALLGSLEGNDFFDKVARSSVEQIYKHPAYRELYDEHNNILHENMLMKSIVGRLIDEKPSAPEQREKLKWMLLRLQKLFLEEKSFSVELINEEISPNMPEFLTLNKGIKYRHVPLDAEYEKLMQEFKYMSDDEIIKLENEIEKLK